MARKPTNADKIVFSAFDLAVAKGWRNVSLADIAHGAGLSLAQVHAAFPTKMSIVRRFLGHVDEEVLKGETDAADAPRDRLFDVIMRRFDALTPHREAIRAILRDAYADPVGSLVTLPRLGVSMAWMLEAAGISSSGLCGVARINGLAVVYAQAFRAWLDDDSPDLAKTMAALDKALRRGEALAGICERGLPGWRRGTDDEEPRAA